MATSAFDIILIGATGFTGRRAAQYLHDHAPASIRWGIAARNPQKLSKLAKDLNIHTDRIFTVDTTLKKQVESVVQETRIIITTAGPFSLYGEEVIAACARFGTHYLDITGEVGFIKKMKDTYEALALESGALLVPFSGFDSVPSDLATFLLSKKFNEPQQLNIRSYYSISSGFNGGTIATMLHKYETGEYKQMNQPNLLFNEKDEQQIHSPDHINFFGFDSTIQRWSTPFIMGPINSKVVYKSAAIMRKNGTPYAHSISYSEHASLGEWLNPFPFILNSLMLIALTAFAPYKWFRNLLKKFMPKPGEGPSEEQIENGYFKLKAIATNEHHHKKTLEMSYQGDPSNKSTILFLCESALCLAVAEKNSQQKSGFLTPATAFGDLLVERLKQRGLKINAF